MFTRNDYLKGRCTHDEYYWQLAQGSGAVELVKMFFGIDNLKEAYEKDDNFNTIPLSLWDTAASCLQYVDFDKYGDYCTLAGEVCVLKCVAKHVVCEQL